MPVIQVEKSDGLAIVTLQRPEALNALSGELRDAIADAFRELAGDGESRVAILTGAGRAFSAGIDLKELGSADARSRGNAVGPADCVTAVEQFPGPVIGAVNGFAITGGFELALACDVLVASTEARFADTHARVGILPGWGLSVKLPRMIGIGRAKELAFTGNYLSAEQALEWGLVNRVVAPDELLPTCRALAQEMLSVDPTALVGYKRVIDEGFGMTAEDARRHEARTSAKHMRGVSAEAVEARRRAVQERGRRQADG